MARVLRFAGCSEEEIRGEKPITKKGRILGLTGRPLQRTWKLTAKKIGLPNWKSLTPHGGRHVFALNYLAEREHLGMRAMHCMHVYTICVMTVSLTKGLYQSARADF